MNAVAKVTEESSLGSNSNSESTEKTDNSSTAKYLSAKTMNLLKRAKSAAKVLQDQSVREELKALFANGTIPDEEPLQTPRKEKLRGQQMVLRCLRNIRQLLQLKNLTQARRIRAQRSRKELPSWTSQRHLQLGTTGQIYLSKYILILSRRDPLRQELFQQRDHLRIIENRPELLL
jgi:hypothetical protein